MDKTRKSPRRTKPGTRTGVVTTAPIEESNPDQWFDSARSPEPSEGGNEDSKLPARTPARKKTKTPKQRVSMGLPGAKGADDDDGEDGSLSSSVSAEAKKYVRNLSKASTRTDSLMSPSNLSRVSTAPPTPRTDEKTLEEDHFPAEDRSEDDDIENPLYTQEGEEEAATTHDEAALSRHHAAKHDNEKPELGSPDHDFYNGNNDEDDEDEMGNDLCPPAHESSSDDDEETMNDKYASEGAKKNGNNIDGLESDNEKDDDNDGLGFNMVHDPETPEAVRAQRAKKEKEKLKRKQKNKHADEGSDNIETEDSKITPKLKKGKNQKKKKQRHVTFSPKGIPAGPRSYDFVPIGALVENSPEEDGPRRSKRARVKPLEFWRGEKMEFGAHNEEGDIADVFGNMPVVTGIQKALPTPYKKRKQPPSNNGGKKKTGRKSTASSDSLAPEEEEFDSRKLRKKYKILPGDEAYLWNDVNDDTADLSTYQLFVTWIVGRFCVLAFLRFVFFFSQKITHRGHFVRIPNGNVRLANYKT
jgi:hypothetical protein